MTLSLKFTMTLTFQNIQVVVGQKHRVPRWYKCFNSVSHALPDYVGKVFVQRYFSIDILEQANKMLNRIRTAFKVCCVCFLEPKPSLSMPTRC